MEPFDVIAYVVLEGDTSSSARVVSNEFSFRITMSRGNIRNCTDLKSFCDNGDRPADNTATPPVPARDFEPTPLGQCFRDQDTPECGLPCVDINAP